ncbi:penicillin acylase family protein [Actinocrinis puniceicyclus]|uniref:Penicillin acylase family protein n=1 Tax=Actinocrinis puniceicyclus TaxID=977794 RepID=A0A8J7WNE1_9ACTN|nr:penicillin acylase family protein [Actinocrinis puniceicyclus]MBS2962640.1 penicillin acylase family protein [Actinocrinis puniceicyclus]
MSPTHPSAAQPSDAQPAAATAPKTASAGNARLVVSEQGDQGPGRLEPGSVDEGASAPAVPEVGAGPQHPAGPAPAAAEEATGSEVGVNSPAGGAEPGAGADVLATAETSVAVGAAVPAIAERPADIASPTSGGSARHKRLTRLRLLLALVVGLVLVLTIATGAGAWAFTNALHASYPLTSGTLDVAGLSAPVAVQRDANGIPQLYAQTSQDLFLAEGYVQAQDRFWQMDIDRHITSGTLASMLGSGALKYDEFVRTLGWRTVAEQSYAKLKPDTKQYLQAYSKGVNAYLATHSGGSSLSIEYTIIGAPLVGKVSHYRPAPWTPIDSVAWIEAMAWDLRDNVDNEIARSLLTQTLSVDQIEQLYPSYPYSKHPTIVTQGALVGSTYEQNATASAALPAAAQQKLAQLSQLLSQVPSVLGPADPAGSGVGSNSWVVSGALTTTGAPLLANDPHLAPSLPSVWYQIGLHCQNIGPQCQYDVSGYSFPGMPGVIIGHNADIAWGFTNEADDVSDLYLEKIDGHDYLYDGKEYPIAEHTETIDVADGQPVTITVRSTRHGPLISDVSDTDKLVGKDAPAARSGDPAQGAAPGIQYAVALQWTALQTNPTMDALFELDRASDWSEFRAAAEDFTVPAQNLVYADTKGNIGYQAPGRIPIRKSGDGRWPVPGWTSAYDWTGYIPFSALPNEFNPSRGFIVTANNAVVGPTYPYTLTTDWDYGYRSQRITDDIKRLTANGRKISVADMASIQNDSYNPQAAQLVPYLLNLKTDAFTRSAQNLLKHWDFTQPATSGAAAYYNAVWAEILKLTFGNKLPNGVDAAVLGFDGGDRWFAVVDAIINQPDSEWWDNPKTTQRETRDTILTAALKKARLDLTAKLGKDVSAWTWGRLHTLTPTEQTLGTNGPGIVKWLLNGQAEQLAGGSSLVDATSWDLSSGDFQVTVAPSMRMIVDLGSFDRSRWVNQTGESGHVDDPNYLDQAPLWAAGQTLPWAFGEHAVKAATTATLTLRPAGP